MLSTVMMAAAAATMLAVGTQDARLLRLGIVAGLWAALLAAFSSARWRREISSRVQHVDQLRAVYQLELQREVLARREHALTVEHELRGQAELSQQREIGQLRAELSAIGANLAQMLGGNSLLERVTMRAESTRLLPLPPQPRQLKDSSSFLTDSVTGPEIRFGPGRGTPGFDGQGKHGAPSPGRSGSNINDTRSFTNGTRSLPNGAHSNGGGALPAPGPPPAVPAAQAQRTVQDLLAAHGAPSTSRRRRTHEH